MTLLSTHHQPTDWKAWQIIEHGFVVYCCFVPPAALRDLPAVFIIGKGKNFHISFNICPDYSVTNWTHLSAYSSSTAEEVYGVFLTHFPRQLLLTKFCYLPTISSYCLSYFLGSDFICSPLSRSDAAVQEYTHPLNSFSEVSEHALDLRKPELLYVAQLWNLFLYY